MIEQAQWGYRVQRLKQHVNLLRYMALREGAVMPEAWCVSIGREVEFFAARVGREVVSEPAGGSEPEVCSPVTVEN